MDFQIAWLFANGATYSGNTIKCLFSKRLKKMRNRESESLGLVTFYLLWKQNMLSDGSSPGMTMLFPYYSSIFTSFEAYQMSGSLLHWNTLLVSIWQFNTTSSCLYWMEITCDWKNALKLIKYNLFLHDVQWIIWNTSEWVLQVVWEIKFKLTRFMCNSFNCIQMFRFVCTDHRFACEQPDSVVLEFLFLNFTWKFYWLFSFWSIWVISCSHKTPVWTTSYESYHYGFWRQFQLSSLRLNSTL